MNCEQCGRAGGVGGEVAMEDSRTAYPHEPCQHTDCLECLELRAACFASTPNPNAPIALCRECAAEHHAQWDAQWAEYHAGLL